MYCFLLRSFSVVYATSVPADSSLVVNTNRGHPTASTAFSLYSMDCGTMWTKSMRIEHFISWIILGVTMSGTLRRRPNAFNLLHQLEFLERTGMSQEMTIKSLQVGKGPGLKK